MVTGQPPGAPFGCKLFDHGGNWMVDLAGLGGARPPIVYITRGVISAALVAALLARSRRWDWLAVAMIAAPFAVRLVTQLVS